MADDKHLLTDIRIELKQNELRPVYAVAVDRRRVANQPPRDDLTTIHGRDNLGQAVIMRLLTPRGELTELGHPEYGSRLHEIIGQQNTETIRNLARLFILESLQREPRIEEVVEATITPADIQRDLVSVLLRVKPVASTETITIGPFTLQLNQ